MEQLYDISKISSNMRDKIKKLEDFSDIIGRHISEALVMVNNFERDSETLSVADRDLKIAVIGQVKYGKSTMLNALLFEGECLLPTAATPMTAALTIIKYAPKMKVEIEFYDKNDWNNIINAAQRYDKLIEEKKRELAEERKNKTSSLFGLIDSIQETTEITDSEALAALKSSMPEEFKASHELVMMSKKISNIDSYLGRTEEIKDISSNKELLEKIENYVGAGGLFSPLVKSSIVYYNDRRLEGFEIIDTPGINDPVISRGQKTKNYLGSCDAIVMLTLSKQPFDSVDMQLLAQHLPDKGIKDIILVGSIFDMALYGEHKKYPDIKKLIDSMEIKTENYIANHLKKLEEECVNLSDKDIINHLQSALPPVFISSMAYNSAKHFDKMNDDEKLNLSLLNKMYKDFTFGPEELIDLSNIPLLKEKIKMQMDKKYNILKSRFADRVAAAKSSFNNYMLSIEKDAQNYLKRIDTEDLTNLQLKEKDAASRLERGKTSIESVFEDLIIKIRTDLSMLVTEMKGLARRFEDIKEKTDSKNEEYEEKVPRRFLFFDVSWLFGYTTETRTRSITYRYANVHESISAVQEFVYEAEKKIKQAIIDIVDIPSFRESIKNGAMALFDLSDINFNFEFVTVPIERAVKRITIPEIEFGNKDYSSIIFSQFSKERVVEDEIEKLRASQKESIRQVILEIDSAVKNKVSEIVKMLEKSKNEFLGSLLKEVVEELDTIKKMLGDKQNSIDRSRNLIEVIKEIKYL